MKSPLTSNCLDTIYIYNIHRKSLLISNCLDKIYIYNIHKKSILISNCLDTIYIYIYKIFMRNHPSSPILWIQYTFPLFRGITPHIQLSEYNIHLIYSYEITPHLQLSGFNIHLQYSYEITPHLQLSQYNIHLHYSEESPLISNCLNTIYI